MRMKIIAILLLVLPVFSWGAEYQLDLPDIDGKKHRLSDYQGKWVVINYWATWCPPCLEEIPELVDFHDQHHKTDAVVLGINFENVDRDYLKTFISDFFISYPILVTKSEATTPFGRLFGLPTTFILSPSGKLVQTKIGGVTRTYLEAVIQNNRVKTGKL